MLELPILNNYTKKGDAIIADNQVIWNAVGNHLKNDT